MRFQFNPFTDKLDISGMGPGATSVDFVTGNSGGEVAADAAYNINVLGDNTTGINTIGNLAPNTLTIFGLASSTTQVGTSRYSTNAEAAAQTVTGAALTPSNITSLFSTHYLPSSQGGTGLSSPAAHSLIVTNGSSPYTALGVASNGQIPIGSVGSNPVLANITSSGGSVTITNGPGTINLEVSGGTTAVETLTGNSGGAISPTAGNINTLGSGSITIAGSGSTLTTQLTGLTNHAVLVGSGTATITKVGPTATAGQVLQSAGSSADPAFSTATYPSTTTINQVLYSSAANTVSGLATANNGVLITSATGVPSLLANGTTSQVLTATTGSPPSWAAISSSGAITTITGDSGGAESPSAGNFNILGSGSITVAGSANTETVQLTGLTNHAILVGAGTSTMTKVGPTATAGQVLQSAGSSADPVFSTATYPSTATGTGTILRADGTNWAATTSTYPNTNAINTLLYASSANVMGALATANSGVLSTNSSGVPSIDTTNFAVLTTGLQLKGNNTNTAPPAGFIGEKIQSTIAPASAVNLPNTTPTTVTSISLTPGVWDVSIFAIVFPTVSASQIVVSISTTTNTLGTNDGASYSNWTQGTYGLISPVIPNFRILVSTTTTYYYVGYAQFAAGSCTAFGTLSATRAA